MANKLSSSLRNAKYRHPQMIAKTKYFAGQNEGSAGTFLRWLGHEWEQAHKLDTSLPDEYKSWKRKYLPVGLANGAAGGHIGLDNFWKFSGGSNDVYGSVGEYQNLNNNTFEPEQTNSWNRTLFSSYDFAAHTQPSGNAFSNTHYNDMNGSNRFAWPRGEYRPVYADARSGITTSIGIADPYDVEWGVEADDNAIVGAGEDIRGDVYWRPEIRTPTRMVLLYDLSPSIPSGAPLLKAELMLTSKTRLNWPDSSVATDWPIQDSTAAMGETGPRRLKVGVGSQYQLSMLHPSTTKHATWGTYNGIDAWTNLTSNQIIGVTCSILPNVFNLGEGNSGDSNKFYGVGWKTSSVNADDNRNAYQRFEWNPNPEVWQASTHPWHMNAITAPSPIELLGITGGGVMVVPSRDAEDSSGIHPDDNTTFAGARFSQGEVASKTGRRRRDVIEIGPNEFNNDESKLTIDITDFARYAIENLGGKFRLALTGKVFSGAGTEDDPNDRFKSESTWSHYAYQYAPSQTIGENGTPTGNTTPYGGGVGDNTTSRAQFPQCGPHTVRTEFYSMNDHELETYCSEVNYATIVDSSDSVFDLYPLIQQAVSFYTNMNLLGSNSPYSNIYIYDKVRQDASSQSLELTLQITRHEGQPDHADWADIVLAFSEIYASITESGIIPGTTVKIKGPVRDPSDGAATVPVTIGSDLTDGVLGDYKQYVIHSDGTYVVYNVMGQTTTLQLVIHVDSPDVNANSNWILRNSNTGAKYTQGGDDVTFGYLLGDYVSTPPFEPDTDWPGEDIINGAVSCLSGEQLIIRTNEIRLPSTNYLAIQDSSSVGSILGITHDIPDGITHDNRGVYTIKSFIDDRQAIEVEEEITNQGVVQSSGGYDVPIDPNNPQGYIPITILDRRPYLKITYSEQEAYGV